MKSCVHSELGTVTYCSFCYEAMEARIVTLEAELERYKTLVELAKKVNPIQNRESAKDHPFDNYPQQMYKIDEKLREEVKALRAEKAELREALLPFAKAYEAKVIEGRIWDDFARASRVLGKP